MLHNKFIYFITFILAVTTSHAGSDFTAIKLNKEMQDAIKRVQTYVSHRLAGTGITFTPALASNLHITLKEIGDINNEEKIRNRFAPFLESVAAQTQPFSIKGAFKRSTLTFTEAGLVKVVLGDHDRLNTLAKKNQKALQDAKDAGKLPLLKKRFDFPHNAHVTIGSVNFENISFDKAACKLSAITSSFNPTIIQFPAFPVKKFILLWSNSPSKQRIYFTEKSFPLKG